MNFSKSTLWLAVAGLSTLPLQASALNFEEALALYTPANLQAYFPGYSAGQYSAAASALQGLSSNSSCRDWFHEGLPEGSSNAISCGAVIDPQLDSITGQIGGDYSALKIIIASYNTQTLTPIISQQIMQATSMRQADVISSALASAKGPKRAGGPQRFSLEGSAGTGLAAGNESVKNGWLAVSSSSVKNDFQLSRYDGDVNNFMGGVDFSIDPKLTVGVSVANETTKLNTPYNQGSIKAQSWTVAPYISYQLDQTLSLDASAGYAWGDQDVKWRLGTAARSTNQDLHRNFLAANLNGDQWVGDWQLSGKAGVIRAEETLDANASLLAGETKSRLTQMRLTGRAGYWVNDVMPYVSLTYVRDVQRSANFDKLPSELKDKTGLTATIGLDFFSRQGISGGLLFSTERGRSHLKNDIIMGNLSMRF